MVFDPVSMDPPVDKAYPAAMEGIEFSSHGSVVNGVIYIATGEGPHPTILLLHGFPGHERNFDLAQIFRRAGWNVIVFHYRGAWGSKGNYRFAHVLEDVVTGLAYFRTPSVAAQYRVDPARVILIGHSLGGWAALLTAAAGHVMAAASISAANLGLWGQQLDEYPDMARPALTQLMEESLTPLNGVAPDDFIAELLENRLAWNITRHAEAYKPVKLMLIAGKRDNVTPVFDHHMPLKDILGDHPDLSEAIIDSDHSFSDSRIALARVLLDWLATI